MTQYLDLLDQARLLAGQYIETLDDRAVMPSAEAMDRLDSLREPMPLDGTAATAVLSRLDELGSPATVATTGGRFFGFVVGGALPVAVAANWLASVWDQNAGTWILSPIAAELEVAAADWLLDLFGLPSDCVVGFVTGSTMGSFSAIAAARSALLRRLGYNVKKLGLNGAPRLRIFASAELHPTNLAALGYAGFGTDDIIPCPVDQQGRIIADLMPPLDDHSIVLVQAGNINSGASDPFEAICAQARKVGAWVHVDGAFGLWARAANATRSQLQGVELADSWSVDGHKWLNLPHDSAVYICRDVEAVQDVFGVQATYLFREGRPRRHPNELTPELSRRARGVEFWAALKHLGRNGVENLIERSCAHAKRFAEGLADAGYIVMNEVMLNQVVFRCADETATRRALAAIQKSGVTWLGPTHWQGHFAMRISVSSWATTCEDVEISLSAMVDACEEGAAD